MTAETLKPFITPQNIESCPTDSSLSGTTKNRQRNFNKLAIGLSTISLVLLIAVLGYTIWLSTRVQNTEAENARLNQVINSMQKRLGLNILDGVDEFEKEYANVLIDDPLDDDAFEYDDDDDDDIDDDSDEEGEKGVLILNSRKTNDNDDDDDDDDDDADDDSIEKLETYDEIQEYIRKINASEDRHHDDNDDDDDDDNDDDVDDREDISANNHEDSSNASDGDNLYDDYEKFKDSKNKKQNARAKRSISLNSSSREQTQHESSQSNHSNLSAEEEKENEEEENKRNLVTYRTTTTSANGALKKHHFVADKMKGQRNTPLRPRSRNHRKIPQFKSGESLILAKTTATNHQTLHQAAASAMAMNSFKPAAHFHLHRKISERHGGIRMDSYRGDMYIGQHPSWSNELGTEHFFTIQNGVLSVREPGLYYVYAQICYNNTHDQNGFVIFHEHTPFLQCLNTVPTNLPHKIHTCHTSGLIYLQENERIHLRDFHSDRNVILKDSNNRSYFGLIKV